MMTRWLRNEHILDVPARELGMRQREASQMEKKEPTRQQAESYPIHLSAPNVHLQVTGYMSQKLVSAQVGSTTVGIQACTRHRASAVHIRRPVSARTGPTTVGIQARTPHA